MLAMLMGIGAVSAEITRGEDDFTGSPIINSWTKGKEHSDFKSLYFRKYVNTSPLAYEIDIYKYTFNDFIFTDTFMEIKIDDNPILQLPVKEAKKMPLANEYDIFSEIVVSIPNDVVEKIRDAKRVACRFQTASGSYVYVLPDTVLAEWKQVIDTEK